MTRSPRRAASKPITTKSCVTATTRVGPHARSTADLRLALVFGGRHDVGPRTGFAISVDVHPTLLDDNQWSNVILLGFGFELY